MNPEQGLGTKEDRDVFLQVCPGDVTLCDCV